MRREGFDYRVVNAGVSGDTSAGGLRRVEWVLRARPEIVIVALGANDGLRGLPVTALRDNLTSIVARLRAGGARVLLAGMRLPPNYGEAYTKEFAAAFPAVARTDIGAAPAVPAAGRGGRRVAEPARRDPSECGRARRDRRAGVACAPAAADSARELAAEFRGPRALRATIGTDSAGGFWCHPGAALVPGCQKCWSADALRGFVGLETTGQATPARRRPRP